jgi:cytoskeletal protein CcmA (bactofilin family)
MSFKPVFSCITEVARLPRTLRVGYSREKRRGRPYTGFTVEQHSRFLKEKIMSAPLSADLAQIGKSVVIKGDLSGSEDLYVDGQVEGSISLKNNSLTVGPNGQVKAAVEAKGVIVQGKLEGNVQASDRVELRKSAVVTGDISTQRISIEEGAYLKGKIDIQGRAEKAAGK